MPTVRHSRWVFFVELFAAANLAFLALDVYLAHLANDFAQPAEWIPVAFSIVAPLALIPSLVRRRPTQGFGRLAGLVVGFSAAAVGIAGLMLHLESHFFEETSLRSLVYTAPFVAPLSYTGLGLLLLLNRIPLAHEDDWAPWVLFLAAAGFLGNFGLSLLDHAQNGFFHPSEWLAVAAAAFAFGSTMTCAIWPYDRPLLRTTLVVMGLQVVVGLVGAYLHARASLTVAEPLADRVLHEAPLFAPLLFADLAVLAAIPLAALLEQTAESTSAPDRTADVPP